MTHLSHPAAPPSLGGCPFDPFDPGQLRDPHPWLAEARREAPVFYVPDADEWWVTRYEDCLAPDSYIASQTLAERLLDSGSLGVIYPSVRREGGTNLACFRPALVGNVRKGPAYRLTWQGSPVPKIEII